MIDFHTHYIPRSVAAFHAAGCTRLEIESPTCGHLYNGTAHYREIDERCWDLARRLADMDERGIRMQVVSPIPVTNSYASSPADGQAYARLHNEGIAELVRARPDRFAGLGAVPLQDVDRACDELEAALQDFGLRGVELMTNVGGRELDDPTLLPFWERCNDLGAIVFLHPESGPSFDRLRLHGLVASVAYPSETGLVASRLLLKGMLTRFPNVRVVLSHGGGTLPWLLPRIDRFWDAMPTIQAALPTRPSIAARAFYADTLVFDAANLALLLQRFGSDRLVVGSDYPFGVAEDPPGAVLAESHLDGATSGALRELNAKRLLAGEQAHRPVTGARAE